MHAEFQWRQRLAFFRGQVGQLQQGAGRCRGWGCGGRGPGRRRHVSRGGRRDGLRCRCGTRQGIGRGCARSRWRCRRRRLGGDRGRGRRPEARLLAALADGGCGRGRHRCPGVGCRRRGCRLQGQRGAQQPTGGEQERACQQPPCPRRKRGRARGVRRRQFRMQAGNLAASALGFGLAQGFEDQRHRVSPVRAAGAGRVGRRPAPSG